MPARKNVSKKDSPLSEENVFDMLKFAKALNIFNEGIYTPELVNSKLKEIGLNPLQADKDKIDKALSKPNESEDQLRGYSEYFELTDMLYKRQIYYLGNLPSWDFTYTCISPDVDYNSSKYKNDEKIVEQFMYNFDYKKEFSSVLRQLVRRETYFCSIREQDDSICLQELNPEYCKITGRWENGFLYDFDFIYFLEQPGVDINMFSPAMKKYFNDIMKRNGNKYIPSMPVSKRDSTWVYWHQMNPTDGFWCFKFNNELASRIPVFSPMFPDLVLKPLIRNLQTNRYMQEAQKILIGLVGINKDSKSGQSKDNMNLNPETIGKFAGLIRAAINESINVGVAPFEDVKSFEYKADGNNLYEQFNQATVSSSGNNARLLYTSKDKNNAQDSENSLAIDEQFVTSIYPYFSDFISYQINRRTKKYRFKIDFEGTQMPSNRQDRLDSTTSLLQYGIVLPQYIAAAKGINPFTFNRQIEMAKAQGFVKSLTPIITSNQLSGKNNGRPQKDESDLSDSGMETRTQGSNLDKGGQI